jgi:hypothetical protein
MTSSVANSPVWSVVERAVMAARDARLDLDDPRRGLVLPTGDAVLGIDLRAACRPSDRWLRDDDLIAIYEPADARRLRATAAWRPFGQPEIAACSAWMLTLSSQTALVQSDSALAVTCDVACADLLASHDPAGAAWTPAADGQLPDTATCLLVRRPAAAATSLFVAVHPADARRIVLRRNAGRATIACWLFSSLIEKGVLLRGRVLAAVGPAAGDESWAAAIGAAFAAAPPPLSA